MTESLAILVLIALTTQCTNVLSPRLCYRGELVEAFFCFCADCENKVRSRTNRKMLVYRLNTMRACKFWVNRRSCFLLSQSLIARLRIVRGRLSLARFRNSIDSPCAGLLCVFEIDPLLLRLPGMNHACLEKREKVFLGSIPGRRAARPY